MGAVALEHQKMRLLNGADTGNSQGELSMSTRIRALKDLAMTLLREVEALGEVQSPDMRRNINLQEEVRRFEIELIRFALRQTGGHQVRAARLLGMKITTLNSKIIRYNIDPDEVARNAVEPRLQGTLSAFEQA